MIRCEDWRNVPGPELERCYRFERARWIEQLHWDVAPTHRLLEGARLTGQAPGVIARDAIGEPVGWAYYLLNQRTLQIGGLVARNGEVTRALLDAVLRSPEADMASELRCFAFPMSGALESALARQRFAIRKHLYLARKLTPSGASDAWRLRSRLSITHWDEEEAVATVRLLARAYAGVASARCFAPHGRLDEWVSYLAQIVKLAGVGHFVPRMSLRATLPGETDLAGVLLATDLGTAAFRTGAAHIAQIVVDPTIRRRGLARDLIETACALAATAGYEQVTLIVAEDNDAARTLYAAAGFEPVSHFVHAVRSAPTRVRQVRPASPSERTPLGESTPGRASGRTPSSPAATAADRRSDFWSR